MQEAIEVNLQRGIKLLNNITDNEYTNCKTPPYFSSIGCHIRHVLDVFSCILNDFKSGEIDLTKRERNVLVEQKAILGITYFKDIISKINRLTEADLKINITVIDDLGLGRVASKTTLGALLMQAQSHATHHFASVGYIIYQQNIELPDSNFGYNPTTIKEKMNI